MKIDPALLYDVIDGTWPAANYTRCGPFTLREGQGGGQRVSAATADAPVSEAEIDTAISEMRAMGQKPIFMIRVGQDALDTQLEARGLPVVDPVVAYACEPDLLTDMPIPRVTTFRIWEPLAIMHEIWASGGIGPERFEVMKRAIGPKTAILGRLNDKPAGVAFLALHKGVAMIHAVEVLAHQRRQGMGQWFMRDAAFWAAEQGAQALSVICTRQNAGANALYASLGMQPVGQYHYRHLPQEADLT